MALPSYPVVNCAAVDHSVCSFQMAHCPSLYWFLFMVNCECRSCYNCTCLWLW